MTVEIEVEDKNVKKIHKAFSKHKDIVITMLLDFAESNLHSLSADDRLNWCFWIVAFATIPLPKIGGYRSFDISDSRSVGKGLTSYTIPNFKMLAEMQIELRKCLDGLFPPDNKRDRNFEWHLPATIKKVSLTWLGGVTKTLHADMISMFWLAVAALLEEYSNRLLSCKECNRIFLKIKRKEYCSSKCSQRVRTRKWYAAHKEEVKEKRRQLYIDKIKETHPKAKVNWRSPVKKTKGR